MFYFYILKSLSYNWLYYGSTSNLKQRLEYHNSGKVKSTKQKAPYKIIYYEAYEILKLAKCREQSIKRNWAAKEEIKKRIL